MADFESFVRFPYDLGSLLILASEPHSVDRGVAPHRRSPTTAMRRQGEIEMRLLIDAQGQVAAVELLTGGRSDFAMAAERAARLWKYRPAMKDGVPVQVKIVEKVAFKL